MIVAIIAAGRHIIQLDFEHIDDVTLMVRRRSRAVADRRLFPDPQARCAVGARRR
jgi:hypothetical protein